MWNGSCASHPMKENPTTWPADTNKWNQQRGLIRGYMQRWLKGKWLCCIYRHMGSTPLYTYTLTHTQLPACTYIYIYIHNSLRWFEKVRQLRDIFLSTSRLSLSLYFFSSRKKKFLLGKLITHQSKCCIRRVIFFFLPTTPLSSA